MREERVIKGPGLSPAVVRLGLALVLLGLASWSLPTYASPTATITVTTTADELNSDGDCSLREAIQAANTDAAVDACPAGSGADTITFDAATDGTPIVLTGAAADDANASGDLDILNGGDLTIQGNGAANTVIDGGGIDRVFHVCPGGGCAGAVTLSGVTVRNGSVGGVVGSGGGILNSGATLNVQDSTIGGAGVGNQAVLGGGICNATGATTTVAGSTISANTASSGGGIYNQDELTIQSSTIGGAGAGNSAITGGGIYNVLGGVATLNSSVVSANTASFAGGIYNKFLLVVQYGSTIGGAGAGNTASGDGGGIHNATGASTSVSGSSVSANTADRGGGIYNQAQLNVDDGSTIGGAGAGNTADTFGGGIYNETGTTTVDGSTVSANTADNGGGIFNQATLTVQNGSTIGGIGAGNTATIAGGGIYNLTSITTLDGSIVSGNTAIAGGGIYIEAGATIVNGSTVSGNTADSGGGIYNRATPLNIQNGSTIGGVGAGNTATNYGGGIYNKAGIMTVNGSTVSANTADNGGGVFNQATLTIQNSSIIGGPGAGNTATTRGGGIYNYNGGTTTVDDSTISANSATGGAVSEGGGIFNEATLNIQNGSTIGGAGAGNTADYGGGGIFNYYGGMTMADDSTVSANTAYYGGGIFNQETLTIQNGSTIGGIGAGNTADYGGGIFHHNGGTTVTGSRILANSATNGGGVYNDRDAAGATSVMGSCIVGNSAMSFFNNQPAQQIATGDWWGVATGPNTPGGDTVGGNVDTSGYLTEPILGCAPDLQVTKANDTGGETTVGTPFHWTLTISNAGLTDAVFNTGQEILVGDLPSGPAYGAPTVADLVSITDGANIDCSIAGNSLTCEAKGGGVTVGTAGSFAVGFSVTSGEAGALSNPAGLCQVDPDGNVTESDENNKCPTDTVEVTSHSIYLPLVLRNASGP
jgi:CSLREA domain-containing protein